MKAKKCRRTSRRICFARRCRFVKDEYLTAVRPFQPLTAYRSQPSCPASHYCPNSPFVYILRFIPSGSLSFCARYSPNRRIRASEWCCSVVPNVAIPDISTRFFAGPMQRSLDAECSHTAGTRDTLLQTLHVAEYCTQLRFSLQLTIVEIALTQSDLFKPEKSSLSYEIQVR